MYIYVLVWVSFFSLILTLLRNSGIKSKNNTPVDTLKASILNYQSYIAKLVLMDHRYVTHKHREDYSEVIMNAMTSQITSLTIIYSTVYSGADQRKHRSSTSLTFVSIWWRHHESLCFKNLQAHTRFYMIASSHVNDFCITGLLSGASIGRFSSERPVIRELSWIIHIIQNELLNIHSSCRWFKTPWRPCDITIMIRPDPVFNPVVIMISATSVVNIFRNNGLTCHICPENT